MLYFCKMKLIHNLLIILLWSISAVAQSGNVVVLDEKDITEISGVLITEIKFKDKIFTSNCSYQEVINILKEKAIANGANLIKITSHKYPDGFSTCHRLSASIYKVENVSIYEKEILWSPERKLVWDDFKAKHSPYGDITAIAAATQCGISFETNRVTNFKKIKYFVKTYFDVNKSWVSAEGRESQDVLRHEQSHFDLCEIYARRLYKELTTANLNIYTLEQANGIYKKVFDEYNERQYQYDVSTGHGTIAEEQEKWNKIIEDELTQLDAYANHF